MKFAVIAQRFENAAANKLLESLGNSGVKALKITLAVNGNILDTYPQQEEKNNYNIFSLAELLGKFKFESNECVIYDIVNPPLLIMNQEQYSSNQPPPAALYNLQIRLVQEAIRFKCSKYIRVGCLSEKLIAAYITKDWMHSKFPHYDSLETVYRIASRDMSKLLAYIGKVDFINTVLSAIVDVDGQNDASIANWLQEYRGTRREQMPIDAILAENLAAILVDIGFQGRNKTDAYIGSNFFYSIDQLIKLLTNTPQEVINDNKFNIPNSTANDLIQVTSAFNI
jgi:hypothetical protein